MDLRRRISLLERAIGTEQRAIRSQKILALAVAATGLIAAALVQIFSGPALSDQYKWILSLSATFISTGAGFPLKDIYAKRNKITVLTFLLEEYEAWQGNPGAAEAKHAEELEKRFWQFFDKSL